MNILRGTTLVCVLALSAALTAWQASRGAVPVSAAEDPAGTEAALKSFAAIQPIDSHVHVFKSDPAFQAMLDRLHLTLLDILVMDDTLPYRKALKPQVDDALALVRSSQGHIKLCTTFDPYRFNDPSFTADSVAQINHDFQAGAIAVKLWKNVGMEIKDKDGKYVMADDPKLAPIYKDIAEHGKTLLTHQAEPDVAWTELDPNDPSSSYYKENPQWHMYNRPGFPAKKTILDARDHVLAANPKLRMVGVHLGSLERDLDGIGQRLDRYPNFAVDMAARMEYLMIAPTEKVRAFLIKYQDRVLYGTDLDLLANADTKEALKDWESTYADDWKFLATDEVFEHQGKKVHGLKLPEPVLRKIFRTNALHWIPGL